MAKEEKLSKNAFRELVGEPVIIEKVGYGPFLERMFQEFLDEKRSDLDFEQMRIERKQARLSH